MNARILRAVLAISFIAVLAPVLAACAGTQSGASGISTGAPAAARPTITVSAASSLRAVLTSVTPGFEKASGVTVRLDFGATGQLVKQIQAGAPVDVLLAAAPSAVASLVAAGLASGETSTTFAGNTLVVLVPKGNPAGIHGPADLAKAVRLATGDPAVAPQGQKAQEWLTGLGLWKTLFPKFVFAANAAQTDEYVARGEVDAGIGFASDSHGRTDLQIAYMVPAGAIKPIRYVGVVISSSARAAIARAYVDQLLSSSVQASFVSAGFQPAPAR